MQSQKRGCAVKRLHKTAWLENCLGFSSRVDLFLCSVLCNAMFWLQAKTVLINTLRYLGCRWAVLNRTRTADLNWLHRDWLCIGQQVVNNCIVHHLFCIFTCIFSYCTYCSFSSSIFYLSKQLSSLPRSSLTFVGSSPPRPPNSLTIPQGGGSEQTTMEC